MIKITGIILSALLLSIILKKYGNEFSLMIVICAVLLVFAVVANDLFAILDSFSSLTDSVSTMKPYINLMLKVLGISLIAQLVSDICRDCGENALAVQTETASKILILIISLPLFEAIIEIVTGLLK